ncbi:diaminobutyrate acetyltransferase [Nocardia sp. NPDC052566]|uniref:diaminobutyrate acetyltransferase n=1 Tax=Nocardia sp. NPDC052566 TaxID=3364330 RepID=UPI0037CB99AA
MQNETSTTITPVIRHPVASDGAAMWRIARDSRVLDLNSSYSYLLWCRDFRTTSVVAELAGSVAGFVTGYLRPAARDTLFVWQVAVDHRCRGRGIGVNMLERLVDSLAGQGISKLETTVSPDNKASIAMFESLARRRGARMSGHPLFESTDFPDRHSAEDLYRIMPLNQQEVRR